MQLAYFLIFFVTVSSSISSIKAVKNDTIIEFLEELRARMCHPIDKWGLPALDPLQISHVETSMNNKYIIDFTGSVTNLQLNGLSDFIINEIKITTFPRQKFTFDFTFPLTVLKTNYTAKGSLAYIVDLSGEGDGIVSIEQVRIKINGNLKLGLTVGIRDLKIMITIGGIEVYFEKLFEEERIDNFFHALINELGLELLDDVWTPKQELVQDIIQKKVNDFLGKFTLSEIIGIIGGGGGGPIFGPDDPPGDCKEDVVNIVLMD